MTTPRINVDSHSAWGRLVKSWATGRDYVNFTPTNANPVPNQPAHGAAVPFPKPGSFKQLVDACKAANVGLHFVGTAATPKTYCTGSEEIGFVLLQGTSDISILRLPAKEKVHESEDALAGANGMAGMDYALPSFYGEAFSTTGVPASLKPMSVAEKMELHAKRIGEYTINTCQ